MTCTKHSPKCSQCPASKICEGQSAPEQYPAVKQKKAVPVRNKIIVIKQNNKGDYYARPRTTKFLNGLYHFEEYDTLPATKRGIYLSKIRQQYSHFTLEADVYSLRVAKTSGKGWYPLAKLKQLPFSMAEKKILEMLK